MFSRKKHFVIYLKEGERIVDALNIMEAHVALMELENVRILKDMRNAVNRKVNCETANIHKQYLQRLNNWKILLIYVTPWDLSSFP